jgi:hypothetical protein
MAALVVVSPDMAATGASATKIERKKEPAGVSVAIKGKRKTRKTFNYALWTIIALLALAFVTVMYLVFIAEQQKKEPKTESVSVKEKTSGNTDTISGTVTEYPEKDMVSDISKADMEVSPQSNVSPVDGETLMLAQDGGTDAIEDAPLDFESHDTSAETGLSADISSIDEKPADAFIGDATHLPDERQDTQPDKMMTDIITGDTIQMTQSTDVHVGKDVSTLALSSDTLFQSAQKGALSAYVSGSEVDKEQLKCPTGMKKITSKKMIFCIDRFEYPGSGQKPRTNVSWSDAMASCKAKNKRLCTSQEWAIGCGSKFSYGKEYDPDACNTLSVDFAPRPLVTSGSLSKCKSPWGLYDMIGNAAEWTQSQMVHGGNSNRDGEDATCSKKSKRVPSSVDPFVGFRCCADPEAP